MPRLHRNNAAEWVMVIALMPIAWIVRLWKSSFRTRVSRGPSSDAAAVARKDNPRKSVMIEGLPPRKMN